MRQCTKCNKIKKLQDFHKAKAGKDGFATYCRSCMSALGKEWRANNKDKIQRKNREGQARFNRAKSRAPERGYVWGLTYAQWEELTRSGICHYCLGPLCEVGHALDRKDNALGYVTGNCVPCCQDCNRMKGKYLTYDEMVLIWQNRRK